MAHHPVEDIDPAGGSNWDSESGLPLEEDGQAQELPRVLGQYRACARQALLGSTSAQDPEPVILFRPLGRRENLHNRP